MKSSILRAVSVGALSLLLPLAVLANSAPTDKSSLTGTVTAKSESSLTLAADGGGMYTLSLAGGATLVNSAGMAISFADIRLGDRLRVSGTISGSITADTLKDSSLAPPEIRTIEGVIGAKTDSSFTLVTKNFRLVTVSVISPTVYTKNGSAAVYADLVIGSKVMATGTWNEPTQTLAASSVRLIIVPPPTPIDLTITGLVTAVNTDSKTFFVMDRSLTLWTVTTSDATVYRKNGDSLAFANISAGALVRVLGKADRGSRTLAATSIDLLTDHRDRTVVKGMVTAKTASSLTIQPKRWPSITIDISNASFVNKHNRPIARADVMVGHEVEIKGFRTQGSAFVTAELVKDRSLDKKKHEKEDDDDEDEDDDD